MSNHANQPIGNWPVTRIESKLLLMMLVVAIVPLTILLTTMVMGVFQTVAIITAVIIQMAGLVIAYRVVTSIVSQAKSINETLVQINQGDFEARAVTVTTDELGAAAMALNTMCDNTLNLLQSNDERDQIQTSIENLISEMREIAAGDLTITAEVNDDITSSIADSVNHMTRQLRSIVHQVQSAAEQVATSSATIRETSSNMSKDSDTQATRISQASQQLLEMTDSFQNVAQLTKESVQVAVEARQTASNGLKAVSDTVDGMQRIRDQVQNTSKRIKHLGESSQEIGEIVQMISDIADRTSILALNASIQAAMAGDAGHGFAVVAEEIESLAERSTDATKQISKLIRSIQNETSEVISDMEESTREVVAGSQLATQAGETLFEIDSVSNQLVELIQASSTSALQQADMASKIAVKMSEISQSTKESAEKNRQATRSVGRLSETVNQLRDSVSQFQVESVEDHFGFTRDLEDATEFDDSWTAAETDKSQAGGIDHELLRRVRDASDLINAKQADREGGSSRSRKRQRIREQNNPVSKTMRVNDPQRTSLITASDEQTERDIDEQLLRQVREATVLLDGSKIAGNDQQSPDNTNRPNSKEQDQSARNITQTMTMDDASD